MARARVTTLALLLLSCGLLAAQPQAGSAPLRVDEAATRMRLEKDSSTLKLAVVNQSGKTLPAQVRVDVLDPQDKVHATAQAQATLAPGAGIVSLTISLATPTEKEQDEALWYRLRYWVKAADLAPIEGIVALAEVTPEIFELRVAAPEYVTPGRSFPVRVRAQHPVTQRPVRGVAVVAQVELGDSELQPLETRRVTGLDGFALVELRLPQEVTGDEVSLTVSGRRGGFLRREERDIQLNNWPQLFVNTDKPLYQPGQVLHVRALLLEPAGRAAGGEPVKFSIKDPDNTLVYQAALTTSRFGIAQADWPIPENLKLGNYQVLFEPQSERFHEGRQGGTRVRISRYELPNFTVNVTPDRAFYLPGQNASVEVSAEYLFGKPVTRGHVRVVREEDRRWNFKKQRWEVEEHETYEGEADARGVFVARVDLSESQDDLKESSYRRFRDVRYAAYFSDPSTGRTEQRRFLLRLTKHPIHIYLIEPASRNFSDKLPLEFYVSAYYADGAPCECDVSIRQGEHEDEAGAVLRTVRTNKYGVAQFSGLALPPSRERYDDTYVHFLLQARDRGGAVGVRSEEIYRDSERSVIRLETERTLYQPGEPIRVEIRASERTGILVFEVWSNKKLAQTQLVRLRDGKAFVMVPYREQFQGRVDLEAYSLLRAGDSYYYRSPSGVRAVLYPQDTSLKVGVKLARGTYKPGEQAVADLVVEAPGGAAVQAAMGAVVFDKAVEERFRSDQEFGHSGGYGFAYAFWDSWGHYDRLGSLSRADLDKLDVSQPFAEDLDLAAEVILSQSGSRSSTVFGGAEYPSRTRNMFQGKLQWQFRPVQEALNRLYGNSMLYPKDKTHLSEMLAKEGVLLGGLLDPWGQPCQASFRSERAMDVMELSSAGPDKQPGNEDDFTVLTIERPYFRPTGQIIDRALQEYHSRTGGFARDAATLKQELAGLGLDSAALRDLWGQPYGLEFGVSNTRFYLNVVSAGPDKTFDPKHYGDDFIVWTTYSGYFAETEHAINKALSDHFSATGKFPEKEADLLAVLQKAGISSEKLRDGWGHSPYMTFNNEARYTDRLVMSYAEHVHGAQRGTTVTPITQQVGYIHLRSPGQDGEPGTADDFELAAFSRVLTEQSARQTEAQATPKAAPLGAGAGSIQGIVTDQQQARISNAKVTATDPRTQMGFGVTADDEGHYELRNLPVGDYTVVLEAPKFMRAVITGVPVRAGQMTELSVTLQVGTRAEVVEVVGSAPLVESTTSMLAASKTVEGTPQPISTPRLRQFFPETLLWQPEVITDAGGRTRLKFKLADNITTWKMSVVASTLDGRIGVADKEFRAFQPFFVELDPPQVLTQGDEIALPVVLRNYLDKSQTLNVSMKPESWFTLLSPAEQPAEVAAGDSASASFRFRTLATIGDGKQRVTAANRSTGDSVEKTVRVHPDGEEVADTSTQLLQERTTLDLDIPDYVIPGTTRAELKIYPNLMDHVLESVEAILKRPYGCGEQTVSSTYPNVMLLRLYKRMGKAPDGTYARSQRYAQMGYQRLLSYRDESGGFTYWGRGDPDVALTAYALRFLQDAAEFVPVDEDVVQDARAWLVQQQGPDGTWGKSDSTTAYVTRVLASTPVAAPKAEEDEREAAERKKAAEVRLAALHRAIDYLSRQVAGTPDAYMLASFALAASQAGKNEEAAGARERLAGLRHEEKGAAYWTLETNTPFYGWGRTGRIETTALAVQALVQSGDRKAADPGLLFLLRNQDRYGTWYSTQATVNVLDALMLLQEGAPPGGSGSTADILVNGRKAATVTLPGEGELRNPVSVNLSAFVQPGANHVEVVRSGAPQAATAQLVAAYYIPWEKSAAGTGAKTRTGDSDALSLSVAYDKTEAKAGEAVKCRVRAERIGHRGYGMLLAEIGLPPAAEVDRASLEAAVNNAGWAVRRYEVLPDRLIVYLWPQAGGTEFEFSFRPRYGMNALTAASFIYDYYNPEASAVIAPTRFVIH